MTREDKHSDTGPAGDFFFSSITFLCLSLFFLIFLVFLLSLSSFLLFYSSLSLSLFSFYILFGGGTFVRLVLGPFRCVPSPGRQAACLERHIALRC